LIRLASLDGVAGRGGGWRRLAAGAWARRANQRRGAAINATRTGNGDPQSMHRAVFLVVNSESDNVCYVNYDLWRAGDRSRFLRPADSSADCSPDGARPVI